MAQMGSDEAEWKRRTADVLQEVGILPSAAGDLALDLFARYQEPHRVYHDTRHITFIFDFAAEHGVVLTPVQSLAILYHDAIYDKEQPVPTTAAVDPGMNWIVDPTEPA